MNNEQPTSGRRRITLDPIQEIQPKTPWREVESTIPCGMRFMWMSGDIDGAKFSLASGASAGNPWATFSYKGRDFCINMGEVALDLIETVDGKRPVVDHVRIITEPLFGEDEKEES